MKINFLKQKKDFKKKNLELNPEFYWKIIILVVLLLTIFSFAFGYYIFNSIKEDSIFFTENARQKQAVEKERLKSALDYFSEKEKKSTDILNSKLNIVDPSL